MQHPWILCVDASAGRSLSSLSEFERKLYDQRADVEILLEASFGLDAYGYDYVAIIRLGGELAIATTSGCSCPSPSETWDIVPATAEEARKFLESHSLYGDDSGNAKERAEALAALDAAIVEGKSES